MARMYELPPRPRWQLEAACAGADPDTFHPHRNEHHKIAQARAICSTCPVIDTCLAYALDNHIHTGVWGGKTRLERKALQRARSTRVI